ncbi:hypothetical protein PPERSA_13148 [Pseudocohnilembus persalinus]|uniref:Uncharacterized protein n=1 Tax=Pseudocohnilembus persalinus TaxID=266149 RepID=A0A0V0QBK0_PSEPJ|nr:hypothetical protein PPERSA_13148 [Pseudocohnilembus persalinus]|eukprot:KRW99568.1 hypothetical protein PPERSA_13148 [Pseudocohnilembus persalinus]
MAKKSSVTKDNTENIQTQQTNEDIFQQKQQQQQQQINQQYQHQNQHKDFKNILLTILTQKNESVSNKKLKKHDSLLSPKLQTQYDIFSRKKSSIKQSPPSNFRCPTSRKSPEIFSANNQISPDNCHSSTTQKISPKIENYDYLQYFKQTRKFSDLAPQNFQQDQLLEVVNRTQRILEKYKSNEQEWQEKKIEMQAEINFFKNIIMSQEKINNIIQN